MLVHLDHLDLKVIAVHRGFRAPKDLKALLARMEQMVRKDFKAPKGSRDSKAPKAHREPRVLVDFKGFKATRV